MIPPLPNNSRRMEPACTRAVIPSIIGFCVTLESMGQKTLFSERENSVIEHLLQGKSNKQIALALGISVRGVEFHLSNIYARLGVSSRTEAAMKLSEHGLRESTGSTENGVLRESAVVGIRASADNNGKLIPIRKVPMKYVVYTFSGLILIALIAVIFMSKEPITGRDIPLATVKSVPTPSVTASPNPIVENCVLAAEIKFCVKGVAQTQEFTYIMLEIKTPPNVSGEGQGFMLSALTSETVPTLKDDQGKVINIDENSGTSLAAFPGRDDLTYLQTLKFPRLDQKTKQATLRFPAVGFSIPQDSSLQINLGENPKPGQVILLDQTMIIQGQEIHMSKAELSGDGISSLSIDIWSDPVELKDNTIGLMLTLGMPKDTNMGTGFGSKMIMSSHPYHIFAELLQSKARLSGLITIPISSVTVYYQGNYEIPFSVPESNVNSQIEPTLEQLTQIAEIRRFSGKADLAPIFVTYDNPNGIWSAMYLTKDGDEFIVEPQSKQVIQFEAGKSTEQIDAVKKNSTEMRDLAEQYAFQNSPKFRQLYDGLSFTEKIVDDRHVFRWEYQKIKIEGLGSPFLQIEITDIGNVIEYINTIDYFVKQ